jgi:prolyl-tRNA synthetase
MIKMSLLFGRTLRQAPNLPGPGTAQAVRMGLVRVIGGEVVLLPLGVFTLQRLRSNLVGMLSDAQEIDLPPGCDRGAFLCEIVRMEVQSHRQLPAALMATGIMELRDGAQGLARPLHCSTLTLALVGQEADLRETGSGMLAALQSTWRLWGIGVREVEKGTLGRGWAALHPEGAEILLGCKACGYLAWEEWARFTRAAVTEEPEPMSEVATPGADTISALAALLSIPPSKTLKAVFFEEEGQRLILAVLRGDLAVSEEKLRRVVGCTELKPARGQLIRKAGADPGYASPVGLAVAGSLRDATLLVIGDLSLLQGANFAAGANRAGYHLVGVNYPRDFQVTCVADIAMAEAGYACPVCGQGLEAQRGIQLAEHSRFESAFHFTDQLGNKHTGKMEMIDLRLEPHIAVLLALHGQADGMVWPAGMGPLDVHVVSLHSDEKSAQIAHSLEDEGWLVAVDERDVSAGVKFADADLIGCPLRITVSERSLERGGGEIFWRPGGEREIVGLEELGARVRKLLRR